MRKALKKESGITLVALIVTIIILLILAGISIAKLTGNGLFEKTKLSKEESENAKELENITLAEYKNKIEKIINNKDEDNRAEILEENPLVIDMSSNISDSGIASASYENAGYYAWCAFSSDETDAWSAWPNGYGSWIMYQFKEPVNISKIEFQAYDEYSVIENFTIYGSNDGVNFEVIYKGKHELNDEIEEFKLESYSKSYTFLKLYADSVYQNGGGVPTIKKLQYYGKKTEKNFKILKEAVAMVPDMTSNTTPSGKVIASYENGEYQAWCAFSSDETDTWSTWPNGAGSWIIYEFQKAVRICKMEMQAYNEYSPQTLTLYGSNDGIDFDIIYKGINEKTADLTTFELQEYSNSYRYLKLQIDSVYDNQAVALKKIQYYGKFSQ